MGLRVRLYVRTYVRYVCTDIRTSMSSRKVTPRAEEPTTGFDMTYEKGSPRSALAAVETR